MPDEIRIGSITELGNGVRVNLLHSDTVPAPETFLSGPELEKFVSFKIEKRRRDWLGGRYAAKTLLKETLDLVTPLTTIEISYDSFGRPVWADREDQRLISITHSGPFCAAVCGPAGTAFLGIDIEKAEPRVNAWYQDYFHRSELELTSHQSPVTSFQLPVTDYRLPDTIHLATRLWTQKEALLKALGLGLTADLLDINLTGDAPEFLRAALKRYTELSSPPFNLTSFEPEPGWYLTIVRENIGQDRSNLLK